MTTQDPASGQSDPLQVFANLPVLPDGDELYDQIMGQIEPELMTASLETLKEKYATETPEQKAEREKKYQKAFAEYERVYREYRNGQDMDLHRYQRSARASLEESSKAEEEKKMTNLESAISDSDL